MAKKGMHRDVYLIALPSNKESASRINFDIAHELGHILLHEWSEDEEVLTREEFKACLLYTSRCV